MTTMTGPQTTFLRNRSSNSTSSSRRIARPTSHDFISSRVDCIRKLFTFVFLFVWIAAAGFSVEMLAQAKPPSRPASAPPADLDPTQEPPTIRVTTELVVVPVSVKDGRGRPVHDLTLKDFRIFEDGEEQEIRDFSIDPWSLSAAILIDTAMSGRAQRYLKETLNVLIESFSQFDEVAVYTFEDRPIKKIDFTSDKDALYAAVKKIKFETQDRPAHGTVFQKPPSINNIPIPAGPPPVVIEKSRTKLIHDSIFSVALDLKQRGKNKRKMILVLSDGKDAGQNENSYEAVLRLLLDSEMTIYAIVQDETLIARGFLNALSKYASATGGDVFYTLKQDSLERIYSRLTEQARNPYVLTYTPRQKSDGLRYKRIEVRVNRPNLDVKAKQGYYSISTAEFNR